MVRRVVVVSSLFLLGACSGGKRGATGPQGPAGETGAQGERGETGARGERGDQGAKGEPGDTGAKGDTGAQGAAGPGLDLTLDSDGDGFYDWIEVALGLDPHDGTSAPEDLDDDGLADALRGATGPQGPAGVQGSAGPQGERGAQGVAGPQGPIGLTGPQGAQGVAGPQGERGLQGVVGPQGERGERGAQGEIGPQGAIGLTGLQGPQGERGERGAQGEVGPQGAIGLTGLQGPQGERGERGAQGEVGPQGAIGLTGLQGPQGERGAQGVPGERGAQGDIGPAGPSGPVLFGYSSRTAAASCLDIYDEDPQAGDGYYWIDPDGSAGIRPFQVYCDMTNGGWIRVEETTSYGFGIYTEVVHTQPYRYGLTVAQIEAIRASSTQAQQSWECRTLGVGNAYAVTTWRNTTLTYAACWDTANTAFRSSSGVHTDINDLPLRSWSSGDCGDATEACEHNVGHAWFR